jgi:hypothetical protein
MKTAGGRCGRGESSGPAPLYAAVAGDRSGLNIPMSDAEYTDRVNTLEAGIGRLDRERIALLREIVQVPSKVVDAIPSDD